MHGVGLLQADLIAVVLSTMYLMHKVKAFQELLKLCTMLLLKEARVLVTLSFSLVHITQAHISLMQASILEIMNSFMLDQEVLKQQA